MDFLNKVLNEIQNEETSAAAGLPGFENIDKKKKPMKDYKFEQKNTNHLKRLLIDFDRVIHSYENGWKDGSIYGYVIKGTKESIDELKNEFEIVIFTARLSESNENKNEQKKLIEEWLNENQIHYDNITADKMPALFYIDDRAITFKNNWKEVLDLVKNHKEE